MVADQHFCDLMATVCAPVAIVTTADDGGRHGATVSSLASVSRLPPLISIALDRGSQLLARILGSNRFGVNVLHCGQADVATRFASKRIDRFDDVCWTTIDGLPHLRGHLAGPCVTCMPLWKPVITSCSSAMCNKRFRHRRHL